MTHPEMSDLYELYSMRVLEPEMAAEIDRHVTDNCEYCLARIQDALALTAALSGTVPQHEPPPELRERVLRTVIPDRKVVTMPPPTTVPVRRSPALLALSAACAALLVISIWLGSQTGEMRTRLAATDRERNQLEAALKSVSRPDTRAVQFGKADQPHGRVFVNREAGLVFVASSLPKLPAGRTFQLWVIPPSGNPVSAGVFHPDANDESVRVSEHAVDPSSKAVAVSIEPQGGSPAPTTTPILVIPLGD